LNAANGLTHAATRTSSGHSGKMARRLGLDADNAHPSRNSGSAVDEVPVRGQVIPCQRVRVAGRMQLPAAEVGRLGVGEPPGQMALEDYLIAASGQPAEHGTDAGITRRAGHG
jgi:hypothetical protein